MAIVKRAANAAAQAAPANVASMNPDNMVQAGLMDDFDGLAVKCRFVPWDYNGNIDHYILGVAVTIQPDEGDEFVQHYSAGELEHFAPSMDGVEAVNLDLLEEKEVDMEQLEGIYAMRVGKKEGLANSTNWAQLITAMLDAGFDKGKLGAACTFIEGVYGHWNRVPQKKRAGLVQAPRDDGSARRNDILVLTEIKEAPKGAGAAKTAVTKARPASAAARPAASTGNGAAGAATADLDTALTELVLKALEKAGDEGVTKASLPPLALKGLPANLKAKGVKRVVETDFLENNDALLFDADAGQVYAAPVE